MNEGNGKPISKSFETGELVTVEYNPHNKGRKRYLEGRIMMMDKDECFFIGRDITASRESEAILTKSLMGIEKNFRSKEKGGSGILESEPKSPCTIERSLVGVFILQDGKFIYVNPGFELVTGYSRDQLLNGVNFNNLIHEDDLKRIQNNYQSRISGEIPADHYRLKSVRSDGATRHIEIISSHFFFKHLPAIIGTVIDITDKLEKKRKLNKAVIEAQENERLQIGMELHDNVKQILVASKLHLGMAMASLDDKALATDMLANIQHYISEAIDALRRLSHQLAPSVDSRSTLTDKIHSLLHSMQVFEKLEVTVDICEFQPALNANMQLTIYRILQEQLTNVLRYAYASRLIIKISESGPKIVMSIIDNGKGFDSQKVCDGIGLENIRRRAQVLNGKMEINSSPGNGCGVWVELFKNNPGR
jgi:PAS domain S-box-containing protein